MRYSILNATLQQVQAVGAKDIVETKSAGIIFALLTDAQAQMLKEQGCVVSPISKVSTDVIAPPIPIAAVPTYTASELIEIAGVEELRGVTDPPLYGEGMNLAIIGTGIRESHEQLHGRVTYCKNYTSDTMQDGFNHDTGVASIAVTVAPKCNILNLKVIGDSGEGTEEEVVLAIDDCISFIDDKPELAPNVINLSLGSIDDGNPNSALRVACRAAIKAGIMVFAACGNQGPNPGTITSPACERYVIAAGSAKYLADQRTFIASEFSSRGPTLEGITKPDGTLFGEDIIMASSTSDTATVAKSGTSFACPFASCMGLLYLEGVNRRAQTRVQLGELPPAQFYYIPADILVDQYLQRISIKPAGVAIGKDNIYGYGLPYGPLALQALQPVTGIDSVIASMLPLVVVLPMMGMIMKMAGSRR